MTIISNASLDEEEIIKKHIKFSINQHIYNIHQPYEIVEIRKEENTFLIKIGYSEDNIANCSREFRLKSDLITSQIRDNKINKIINE